ncbi:MAG: response regulator transcription factor [Acidimicrobiia bacterium]|nr:response regulator transcription factor [Acidimicrobiia bacterium]
MRSAGPTVSSRPRACSRSASVILPSRLRAVAVGRQPLDPRVVARVLARSRRDSDEPSARELEVLVAVAEGFDNAAIARTLYISQATVKSHLTSLFTKLGVSSRTGAVAEARRRGHLR